MEGDRNNVSVHVGRRRTADHRTRLLIGLAAALAAVATAAYLVSRNSGIPEYFQTGLGAGIYVPPSSPNCGNVTPDVLVSPAGNVFTDVSEAHALSLDGRSAFLMQGTFDGAIYHWVISDPGGEYGGAQLRWWVKDGKLHYCSISLAKASPVQAQEGIRHLSSMAVPAVVNGKSVMFQACVWYTVREGDVKNQCWP